MRLTLWLLTSLVLACSTDPGGGPIAPVEPLVDSLPTPLGKPIAMMISPAAASTRNDGLPAPLYNGHVWTLVGAGEQMRYPIPAQVGDTITEWIVYLWRDGLNVQTRARLQRLEVTTTIHVDVGPSISDPAQGPGYVALHLPPCPQPTPEPCLAPELVNEDNTYSILVEGAAPGDTATSAAVYARRTSAY